jgi:hypothetical protein
MLSWLRRRKTDDEPSPDLCEARDALESSIELVRATQSDTGEILRVTNRLKRASAGNNFAAAIKQAMGGTG